MLLINVNSKVRNLIPNKSCIFHQYFDLSLWYIQRPYFSPIIKLQKYNKCYLRFYIETHNLFRRITLLISYSVTGTSIKTGNSNSWTRVQPLVCGDFRLQRLIFRNFKIANIKITKDELFDNFIFQFNFSFFKNHSNTQNI